MGVAIRESSQKPSESLPTLRVSCTSSSDAVSTISFFPSSAGCTRDRSVRIPWWRSSSEPLAGPMAENKVKDFQIWIRKSREAAKRNPERYLVNYDFEMDEKNVWMTKEEYDLVLRNCGAYNGTIPTGRYCGKLF